MIETRFVQLSEIEVVENDLWNKYIENTTDNIDTKQYIFRNIFPRPRDLIYFLTTAKNISISRGHELITSDDIKSARKDYSNWVFKSILVENGITISQMENFMYNMMGENAIL